MIAEYVSLSGFMPFLSMPTSQPSAFSGLPDSARSRTTPVTFLSSRGNPVQLILRSQCSKRLASRASNAAEVTAPKASWRVAFSTRPLINISNVASTSSSSPSRACAVASCAQGRPSNRPSAWARSNSDLAEVRSPTLMWADAAAASSSVDRGLEEGGLRTGGKSSTARPISERPSLPSHSSSRSGPPAPCSQASSSNLKPSVPGAIPKLTASSKYPSASAGLPFARAPAMSPA
mmetsp:Transcript_147297/g.473210  ORF Transcript_147297/g.473210 Transcript_147297/m.473210 type:complete len:234 (+) Transcript_147297:1519-2220(+)